MKEGERGARSTLVDWQAASTPKVKKEGKIGRRKLCFVEAHAWEGEGGERGKAGEGKRTLSCSVGASTIGEGGRGEREETGEAEEGSRGEETEGKQDGAGMQRKSGNLF